MSTNDAGDHPDRAIRQGSIASALVRLPGNGRTFSAICTNVSDLGMRLRFTDARYFQVGREIEIDVPVFGFVRALICWVQAPRVGVKFVEPVERAAQLPWTSQSAERKVFEVPAHLAGHARDDGERPNQG